MATIDGPSANGLYLFDGTDQGRRALVGRHAITFFLALAVFYIALRAWGLTESSLWLDEIFSVQTVRLPWGKMFGAVSRDKVHPPLFYILLKLWIAVGGESLLWIKLLPLSLSVLTLIPIYLLCREVGASAFVADLVLLLMIPNTFLIHYAQEVRMYSMLLLLTTVSIWLLIRYLNRPPPARVSAWWFVGVNFLLVSTHYYGWLVVLIELAFILALYRRRFTALILPAVPFALLYLAWIVPVVRRVVREPRSLTNIEWLERPGLAAIWGQLGNLTGSPDLGLSGALRVLLSIAPLIAWIAYLRGPARTGSRRLFGLLLVLTVLPVILAFVASAYGPQPFWHSRYLIIIAPPFMLLVAAGVGTVRPMATRWILALFVIGVSIFGYFRPYKDAPLSRVKWQAMAAEIGQARHESDSTVSVYAAEVPSEWAVKFYLQEAGDARHQVLFVDDVSTIADDRFWLVYSPAFQADRARAPVEGLIARGYSLEHVVTYGSGDQEVRLVWFAKR